MPHESFEHYYSRTGKAPSEDYPVAKGGLFRQLQTLKAEKILKQEAEKADIKKFTEKLKIKEKAKEEKRHKKVMEETAIYNDIEEKIKKSGRWPSYLPNIYDPRIIQREKLAAPLYFHNEAERQAYLRTSLILLDIVDQNEMLDEEIQEAQDELRLLEEKKREYEAKIATGWRPRPPSPPPPRVRRNAIYE